METSEICELVLAAQDGDRDAFGQLVTQFEPTVMRIVLRRLRNYTEAAEATQDVFIQAMRKLSQLREPERFPGWLRQIAARMAINRAVRKPPESACAPETFASLSSTPDSPLDGLIGREDATELWGGLQRLREVDRRTLIAFYFEGHSLKQMSADFDSPIGTIKRRLHTARIRLRDELAAMQPA